MGKGKAVEKLLASIGADQQKHGVLARAPNQSLQAAIDENAPDADKDEEAFDERGSPISPNQEEDGETRAN